VYGTSSYQGFPYRHPFVTRHEVVHDGDEARLAEGQLMTPQMLIDVMAGLGRSVPVEILPERVLVRTAEMIVWWTSPGERTMFFSDRGEDPLLTKMNGKRYPQPPLLFKACGTNLWIRALDKRRTAESGHPDVYGPVLELLRQWRGVHREYEDSAREIGNGDRGMGAVILSERIHPRLRYGQAHAVSRWPASHVAVPRRKEGIPEQVSGEVATDTRRIRERP
jgi:hypothetical protein